MEITFPAGIGRVRGQIKSYKSLQGIAASRDGVGSAGTGLLFSPLFERKSINLWKLLSLRGLSGCGGKSNPINLYKSSGSLYGIAASRDGVVITG